MNRPADAPTALRRLDALLTWFGEDRVRAVLAPLQAPGLPALRRHHLLQRQWVVRDLMHYQRARDAHAVTEDRVLEHWVPLARLASAILRFDRPGATSVPRRFRDLLLGEACADYAFELISAAHHDWRGYAVRWLPEDSGEGEFAIEADGAEAAHVECKRIAADAIEELRADSANEVATLIDTTLEQLSLSGAVSLTVGPALVGRPALLDAVRALLHELGPGRLERQSGDLVLTGTLDAGEAARPYGELLALTTAPTDAHRSINGVPRGEDVIRFRVLDIEGPKRSLDWFTRKIEDVICRAAERQLPADRPGVICLELPMFRTATPEEALELVSAPIEQLFLNVHIIGLLATLAPRLDVAPGMARARNPGRIVPNAGARFPLAMGAWRDHMTP